MHGWSRSVTPPARSRALPERGAGILLHPTSLPGRFGVGDLGPAADAFLAWAADAGQSVWQMLPVGPTGPSHSPYVGLSVFAGNPLLVSPERLVEDGLLRGSAVARPPAFRPDHAEFDRAAAWKDAVLRASWDRFRTHGGPALREAFQAFRAAPEQAAWLDDFTLFMALRLHYAGRSWSSWEQGIRRREPEALRRARRALAGEVAYQTYLQFLFDRQWRGMKGEAERLGIRLFGDLPIYVAHDSADVWVRQDLFALDAEGRATAVAGVPPDYFSATGQRWGNPLYRWDRLEAEGYAWWIERVRANLGRCDLLRVDHFRGFAGYWEIPGRAETAIEGRWVDGPGVRLFDALRTALGDLPLVAEDLGHITPDVRELRKTLGIPGMRVLQFAFDGSPDNPHLPRRHEPDCAVYTGTHDNDTVRGWFDGLDDGMRRRALEETGGAPETIAWDMIRAAYRSVGFLAVVPLQDVLGLGGEARFNVPGVAEGNWTWRADAGALGPEGASRLAALVREAARGPFPADSPS